MLHVQSRGISARGAGAAWRCQEAAPVMPQGARHSSLVPCWPGGGNFKAPAAWQLGLVLAGRCEAGVQSCSGALRGSQVLWGTEMGAGTVGRACRWLPAAHSSAQKGDHFPFLRFEV